MRPTRIPVRRARSLIQSRFPPGFSPICLRTRAFTHNSNLLLVVSTAIPRPQLPFLHPTSNGLIHRQRGGQWQMERYLTTETRKHIKQQIWLASKWTLILYAAGALLSTMVMNYFLDVQERETPSPREWSIRWRLLWRWVNILEDPEWSGHGIVDWAHAGTWWYYLLQDIESDGDFVWQKKDQVLGSGVGKPDWDLSAKSEPWRRGYFEVLMGCGRSAEHLENWVADPTRGIMFPREVMIGPSNPNPRPVPPTAVSAPLEENCRTAYDPPETFYMKIIDSKGFNTAQRLEAAIAYGDWLNYKGLSSSAEDMYKRGLDIATSAIPNASTVIDSNTAVIQADSPVSTNIVNAATALATHHARTANAKAALPIFLSVLRARRAAPVSPYPPTVAHRTGNGTWDYIASWIFEPPYPLPPPSGDLPLRRTPGSQCQEAALMTYIGEILFATSPSSRETGIAWTREAAKLAEAGIDDGRINREDSDKCVQCYEAALSNWEKMAGALASGEKASKARSWGALWSGKPVEEILEEKTGWDVEREEAQHRIMTAKAQGLNTRFKQVSFFATFNNLTWIG